MPGRVRVLDREGLRPACEQKLRSASAMKLAPLLREGPAKLDAETARKIARWRTWWTTS